MTIARRKQICLDLTPYYHCITRCVRRSFLCGKDNYTGRDFEHRRGWIEKKLLSLSEVFCIDVAGYAVMSNHYHLVLRVDKPLADSLPDAEVIRRWRRLYKGPEIIQLYLTGQSLDAEQRMDLQTVVAQWRDNLSNLSRFMGNLNESISRWANKEDGCKGTFWESRFKTQAILDLPALLRTLCYVDLNPVRAKMAKTPEDSKHTSIMRRLKNKTSGLIPFSPEKLPNSALHDQINQKSCGDVLPITFNEYLDLVDWTGRQLSKENSGSISAQAPDIMERLGYSSKQWMKVHGPGVSWTQRAVGHIDSIKKYCSEFKQSWIWQAY